jgi:hypothetical protein
VHGDSKYENIVSQYYKKVCTNYARKKAECIQPACRQAEKYKKLVQKA